MAIPFFLQVVSLALDLCVHPDVVNRHKQVRIARRRLTCTSLSSLLFHPDTSGLQFGADGADARGDAREDGLRSAAARRRRQCEPHEQRTVLAVAACSCRPWSRTTERCSFSSLLGVQIVMFDSSHGRTCLHYAAYYGHADCLRAILSAAKSAPVSESWLAFFVAPQTPPSRRRSSYGAPR